MEEDLRCTVCGGPATGTGWGVYSCEPRCSSHVDVELTKLSRQVAEFHKAFDLPTATKPVIPTDDRVRLRLKLIFEEAFEALEACVDEEANVAERSVRSVVEAFIEVAPIRVSLPLFIDALADIDYVVEGSRLEFGVNGMPIADEVQRSNLSKIGGEKRADGKHMKGPNFTKPDILSELKKQGWMG